MGAPRIIGVIDIGKTNAKVAVVDLDTRSEIAVRKTPNVVSGDGPYPHFQVEALWDFICSALAALNGAHPLDAISVTTHGAAAALIDAEGQLALPVLDYEFAGPDALDADYAAVRPAFGESFTPPLPGGLNLGKQLFWQARHFPREFARTRWILPYPQYWSFRLSGVASAEITSLGCHTDLWDFGTAGYSSLVSSQGWRGKFPEVRPAFDTLGPVLPDLVLRLGLGPGMPVYSGIHDSNASLLPHVLMRTPPYSVVSTGTWVIVCSPGGDLDHLNPARDSFANIDALGHPVPSARFMGGREFSLLIPEHARPPAAAAGSSVLEQGIMLLPSVVNGSGPYPERHAEWTVPPGSLGADTVQAAVSFYLALMTAECLALTGAAGTTIIEGPFAENALYVEMLGAATGRPVISSRSGSTGTAVGAALLADRSQHAPRVMVAAEPPQGSGETGERMAAYARRWRQAASV